MTEHLDLKLSEVTLVPLDRATVEVKVKRTTQLSCPISVHRWVAQDAITDTNLVSFVPTEETFVQLEGSNVLYWIDSVKDESVSVWVTFGLRRLIDIHFGFLV